MKHFIARWFWGRTGGMRHAMLSWQLALAVVAVLNAGGAWYAGALTFNNAPEVYYPEGSPAVALRDKLRQDFPSDELLTVLFRGPDLYSTEVLRKLARLVEAIERDPLVDRVSAITNMEHISGSADGFAVERLIDLRDLQRTTPEALQARVMADRFAPGLLASRDGQHLAMAVRPKPLQSSGQRLQIKLAVARAINDAGLRPYYAGDAGPITLDVAQLDSILSDSERFVPLTVVVGLALMAWVVGRWRPVLIGAVAMSTVVTPVLAGLAASGVPYTMASAILPSLLTAYTVATLLHLYAGVQRAQRVVTGRAAAVDQALGETRKPALFNVLTTGAGLLSLLLVPIPPIQVFGFFGAMGTVAVFLTVYWLVPPFLRHWDGRPWPQKHSAMGRLGRLARRLTVFSIRRPGLVLGGFAVSMLLLVPYAMKVEVETDLLAFFADDHPVNVETRAIESALVGVTTLELSLQGANRDTFQRVQTLRKVQALQRWLDQLPQVDRSISMVDLVEEMHWAMNGEEAAFRALPPTDRLLRQYLLVYDGADLYELVNRDYQHARMVLSLNVHGTKAIRETIEQIHAHVAANPIPGVEVDVGGTGRLLADQTELLVGGQASSFLGAFAQIFIIMALMFRSLKASAVCLAPNVAPMFYLFALMGFAGIRLDLATVMIAGVVLGITVDDTIHLFHGYRERIERGMAPMFAILRSYDSSGRAVLATSTVLIAQFGLLALSDFVPTSNFGLMTATGLLSGLIFELLMLPPLLLLVFHRGLQRDRPRRERRRAGPRFGPAAGPAGPAATEFLPTALMPARHGVPAPQGSAAADAVAAMPSDVDLTARVLVCTGSRCREAGGRAVLRRLLDAQQRLERRGGADGLRITKTSCLGPCQHAPVMQVYPEGTCYGHLDAAKVDRFIAERAHCRTVEAGVTSMHRPLTAAKVVVEEAG
ncbi:MAG: MMPL family transporter [Betaproteobacteria bacterium]|nr:MMPL family transporter [Betaproteobacteria bacterium]